MAHEDVYVSVLEDQVDTPSTSLGMSELRTYGDLPPEIWLCIFDWICWDEIDLTLMAVSQSMRHVLRQHPVVQTLAAFEIHLGRHLDKVATINPIVESVPKSHSPKPLCLARVISLEEIVTRVWCQPHYVWNIQHALMRSIIKKYWAPCLLRDGRLEYPDSLTNKLDKVTTLCRAAVSKQDEMVVIYDSTKEYSWTRIHIWPLEGRASIRDQVFNTVKDIHLGLVTEVFLAKHLHQRVTRSA